MNDYGIHAGQKITILAPSLRGGGLERQSLILAGELVKRGIDSELVLINGLGSVYTPSPSIRVVDLQARRIRFALSPLMRYLRETKPEVVFSGETPVNALVIAAKAVTGYPRRLVVSERTHVSSVSRHSDALPDRLRPLIVRFLYPRADAICTVSLGVAEDLVESYGIQRNKVRVLYNMFDMGRIAADAKEALPHPWFGPGKPPVIINVGRLAPQKDQATLIRAFAIVRSSLECRLLILGEGVGRGKLEALAAQLKVADNLSMPGFVSNPYAYMSRAQVFVLSSAWEGLAGVLVEALAAGVPIVSTDCPSGPAEILENGRYGTLSPVGNPQALALAILQTLESPLSADVLRRRALDFSIGRLLPEYLRVLINERPFASRPT